MRMLQQRKTFLLQHQKLNMNFLDFLEQKNIIEKSSKVQKEWKKQGGSLESFLIRRGLVKEAILFQQKASFLNVALKKVNIEAITPEAFGIIPKESIEFYKMIAFGIDKERKVLEVGMVYPSNAQAQEALKFLTRQHKLSLKVFLITISDFNLYLKRYKAPEQEVEKALEKLEQEIEKEEQGDNKAVKNEKFSKVVEEAPIIKMTAVILRQAVEGKASDIHIEPTNEDLRIRYRLDGILYTSLVLPLKVHPAIVARIKILSRLRIDETRIPQDGRFSTNMAGRRVDFRVSTFPTTLGEKVVIRVLDPSEGLNSLEALGFFGRNLKVIQEAINKPYGMLLVTGPTGSGKTTTLYTTLRILNKEEVNIVTLEDPVEYFMAE